MSQARVSITPSDAWSDQRLTPLQCRLLGLIGSYLGKDHRAWPSQGTLAEQLGVSRKAVNDGVRALKTYGYIEVEARRRNDGGQTSNCYFVRMDPLSRGDNTPYEAEVTPPPPQGDTPVTLALHPLSPLEVTPPVTPEGDTMKDPIERPNRTVKAHPRLDAAFDRIWIAWSTVGRRRSAKKTKCRSQLLREAGGAHSLDEIATAAEAFAAKTGGEYHPALERWLRDGKYENWIAPTTGPTLTGLIANEPDAEAVENARQVYLETGEWVLGGDPPSDLLAITQESAA